jgi:hypothetical protein
MEPAEGLSTVAQVGMSLTGFAGLLIAFRFGQGEWQRVEIFAVRFLFKSSIGACMLALLPLLPMIGDISEAIIWALCMPALGTWVLALAIESLRARLSGVLRPRYPVSYWFLALSGVTIGLLLLLGTFDIFGLRRPVIYMAGLYWLLAVAMLQLMMQVMQSLRSIDVD